jgi:thiol-disulfide isomerase/thioredoxin
VSGSVWIASYVLLWIAVIVLGLTCLALLRQIGVLHARVRPLGAHPAGEGPTLDAPAPPLEDVAWADAPMTLMAFTSPTCEVCKQLLPSLAALRRQYDGLLLLQVDLDQDTRPIFDAFNVRSSPYVVAVDEAGVVRGSGVANSLEQLEELLLQAQHRATGVVDLSSWEEASNGDPAHR